MNSPILTAQNAEDLNKLVRTLIDPRLFLLCNYEPTVRHVIGEDGHYLLNIQDLYKFAIDSSCAIKHYYKIIPKANQWQFSRLQKLLDIISMLRTVFDHNTSDMNGRLSAEYLTAYASWVRSAIGKTTPETEDDFKVLNRSLESIAAEMLQLLEKFVRCAARDPDRRGVVRSWMDMTLYWYCNNTKTDIYKGHLIDAYIANAKATNHDTPELYRTKLAIRKVNRWIEDALFYPVQAKIKTVSREIANFEEILNGHNSMFEGMRAKMAPAKVAEVEQNFRLSLHTKRQELAHLENEMDKLKDRIGNNKVAYFYRNLENQLRDTIEYLEKNDISYTFLPQDLIQEDIARIFGSVPSPDEDF